MDALMCRRIAIAESDNLVIYGHHIKGGHMFGALEDYK